PLSICYSCSYDVYFFFQAEDGIRDFHVTGVQTCALPISRSMGCPRARGKGQPRNSPRAAHSFSFSASGTEALAGLDEGSGTRARSEERRVGKECRCRWAPED